MDVRKKITKSRLLFMLALVSILVLLFPIPMSRSKEESYVTTEVVNVPFQVRRIANWSVTWFVLTVDKQWGPTIATDTWYSPTFLLDWGYGVVYGRYDDGVGFTASTSTYVEISGIYTFTLGSDDGSQLYLDGNLVINNWKDQTYVQMETKRWIAIGWHTLVVNYYEYLNAAKVYFDVDKGDFFTWQETQYMPLTLDHYATRTVTERAYVSILQYLMNGGKP